LSARSFRGFSRLLGKRMLMDQWEMAKDVPELTIE
jgi:hypothetical protein